MTFKTKELPFSFNMTFNGDEEIYHGVLLDITEIDEEKDTCVLIVDDLMPQTAKLQVPYSSLDSDTIEFETGVRMFL